MLATRLPRIAAPIAALLTLVSALLPAPVLAQQASFDADRARQDRAQGRKPVTVTRNGRAVQTTTFEQEILPDGRAVRAGSLIVKFRRDVAEGKREEAHLAAGAEAVERLGSEDRVKVRVRPGTVGRVLSDYRGRADVERAGPDYVVRSTAATNDPLLGEQYGLEKVGAAAAWGRSHSSPSVPIAILDCGVYAESSGQPAPDGLAGHPDLRGKVIAEVSFSDSPDTDDWCDHGSHVAGIAAAATGNGVGVAGLGHDARILNGKVLDDTGSGSDSSVIQGIIWATERGAKVINMSLGREGACPSLMQDAVNYAWSRGVVIVASAGNSGAAAAGSPANCDKVIAVGATDQVDGRPSFSNYGTNVDVAAPGSRILSSTNNGNYGRKSGTSMASPFVAGLAALVWSTPFGTSNAAVVDRFGATADRISGTGSLWTQGRINAAAAVAPPAAVSCSPRPRVTVSTTPAGTGRLQVTVAATGVNNTVRELRFGAATNALIDVGGQDGRTGNFTMSLPSGTNGVTFFARRASGGVATTVPFVVADGCGDWPTFVGGGAGAF
jgi:thermitase